MDGSPLLDDNSLSFSQVGIGLIKSTDEHRVLSPDIDNHRNGSMTGFLDYFHTGCTITIEINLAECQAF